MSNTAIIKPSKNQMLWTFSTVEPSITDNPNTPKVYFAIWGSTINDAKGLYIKMDRRITEASRKRL